MNSSGKSGRHVLLDSYVLQTVYYQFSSWKSWLGKTKQHSHSIRMMFVGEGVCVIMFTTCTSLCLLPITLWPGGSENNDPLFRFHKEIFTRCLLGITCCHGQVQTMYVKY